MHTYKFNLSFRVRHPERDLAHIYVTLGRVPSFVPGRIWKVGDDRQTPRGEKLEGHYDESYCFFRLFDNPQSSDVETPSAALGRLVTSLAGLKDDLRNHVESGGTLELLLSVYVDSNSGETFRPDLMGEMANLQIQLSVDIYPPNSVEQESE